MSPREIVELDPTGAGQSINDQIRVNLNYWFDLCELRGAIVGFPDGPNLDHAKRAIEHLESYFEEQHDYLIAKLASGEKDGGKQ